MPTDDGRGVCFISHSYGDKPALAACLARRLPNGWAPLVFEPIEVSPNETVSRHLVDSLRGAAGLVYLDTPTSLGSFWVGFERNMAARLGKPVYAFRSGWFARSFVPDPRPPVDPMVSVLFNLCVGSDRALVQRIRHTVWERYRFEFRGTEWHRLDNEERQMFDTIEGMRRKLDAGGIAMVFLSTESVCCGYHDYVDPFTFRRARKDGETPVGYTAEKFASLIADRTLIVWLGAPDRARIEAALAGLPEPAWTPYVELVRASLTDPARLVVAGEDGSFDLHQLDSMFARCFWAGIQADPGLAASFRASIAEVRRG